MFKLESYVTPYILAYLGKYFKNFDSADFQMSLWGGGALFQNLNLDLDVVNEELNLPLTLVSGHIQGLRITVPWTKLTSEPIQVNVNTIEIKLRLKRPVDGSRGKGEESSSSSVKGEEDPESEKATVESDGELLEPIPSPPPPPPSGYIQGLIAKILSNVHVTFENVILKYVDEDIVLSLNIKKAAYATCDPNWKGAFIDLTFPDYVLRKSFTFQDLTACLDQVNCLGKVENYTEPFLYRCAFDVRIYQKFPNPGAPFPTFTRTDFHFHTMHFSVTEEQIPMVMRLYVLVQSLTAVTTPSSRTRMELSVAPHPPTPSPSISSKSSSAETKSTEGYSKPQPHTGNNLLIQEELNHKQPVQESKGKVESSEVREVEGGWTSWAFSWLPPISTFIIGEEYEDGDVDDLNASSPPESSFILPSTPKPPSTATPKEEGGAPPILTQLGIYFNRLQVIFKIRCPPPVIPQSNRPLKVATFIPFLVLDVQGGVANLLTRGQDINQHIELSMVKVSPLGDCPCGGVHSLTHSDSGNTHSLESNRRRRSSSIMSPSPSPSSSGLEGGWSPHPIPSRSSASFNQQQSYLRIGTGNPDYASNSMFISARVPNEVEVDAEFHLPKQSGKEGANTQLAAVAFDYLVTGDVPRMPSQPCPSPHPHISTTWSRQSTTSSSSSPNTRHPPETDPLTQLLEHWAIPPSEERVVWMGIVFGPQLVVSITSDLFHRGCRVYLATLKYSYPPYVLFSESLPLPPPPRTRLTLGLGRCEVLIHEVPLQPGEEELGFKSNKVAIQPTPPVEEESGLLGILRSFVSIHVTTAAFVVSVVESPVRLTSSLASSSLLVEVGSSEGEEEVSWVSANLCLKGLAATASLRERDAPLVNPTNGVVKLRAEWVEGLTLTYSQISLDPISVFIGPQSVLVLQQVVKAWGQFLEDCLQEEAEIVEVVEEKKSDDKDEFPPPNRRSFTEDDLRSGGFTFLRASTNGGETDEELPLPGQIVFCDSSRSMSWRYRHPRLLTSVTASPVPLHPAHHPSSSTPTKLDCVLEHWDEGIRNWRHFGMFTLSETDGASWSPSSKLNNTSFNSSASIWRVKIATNGAESSPSSLVSPSILAACLHVNSVHDPGLVPSLKLSLALPRLRINFLNNLYFAGRGPCLTLPGTPSGRWEKEEDQIWASLSLESASLHLSTCDNSPKFRMNMELGGFLDCQVLNYEWLTMAPVLPPTHFSILYSTPRLEVWVKELEFKVGASCLHTISTSAAHWSQVMSRWDGRRVSLLPRGEEETNLPSLALAHIFIHNTLPQGVAFVQGCRERDLPLQPVPPGFTPFYWATNKSPPLVKLGLPTESGEVRFTPCFDPVRDGYSVRSLPGNPRVTFFTHGASLGGIQRLITISGPLLVANGLSRELEVGILGSESCRESTWSIPGSSWGSSQLLQLDDIQHLRFRWVTGGRYHPWSDLVTPTQLRESNPFPLRLWETDAEASQELKVICVWASLIVESTGGGVKGGKEENKAADRFLILISPCFRLQSYLPAPTHVHITPPPLGLKVSDMNSTMTQSEGQFNSNHTHSEECRDYFLPGMGGGKLDIDWTSSHTSTKYLTVSNSGLGRAEGSKPPIPLLPTPTGQPPILHPQHQHSPPSPPPPPPPPKIDEILTLLTKVQFGSCLSPPPATTADIQKGEESSWPFIQDHPPSGGWRQMAQPRTDLEVDFVPWIPGLPTLVLIFRPSALIINLTSEQVYLGLWTGEDPDPEDDGEIGFLIPFKAVFAPPRISMGSTELRFGIYGDTQLLLSEKLALTEELGREDIHHVNKDNRIPLNTFSRLDLLGQGNQIGYLSIECRVVGGGIIQIILRPTFSLVNGVDRTLVAAALAISPRSGPSYSSPSGEGLLRREDWFETLSTTSYPLPPNHNQDEMEACPLLRWSRDRACHEYNAREGCIKYLALSSSHSPFWFVQLMNFDLIFNNVKAGLLAASISTNIPTTVLLNGGSESVSLPILVSWTVKDDGGVWISISPDPSPQLLLHNTTRLPLLFVQAQGHPLLGAARENPHFEQYLVLPPESSATYAFPRSLGGGGGLAQLGSKTPAPLPHLLLTRLPLQLLETWNREELERERRPTGGMEPDRFSIEEDAEIQQETFPGTLLLPDGMELNWTARLIVDGEGPQYFSLGDEGDAKIRLEKVGFSSFFAYIEKMWSVEERANRSLPICYPFPVPPPEGLTYYPSVVVSMKREEDEDSKGLEFHAYLPKIRLILRDDSSCLPVRPLLLSLTLEEVVLEGRPTPPPTPHPALFVGVMRKRGLPCLTTLCTSLSIQIGDFQLDSPSSTNSISTPISDFPVIIQQLEAWSPLMDPNSSRRMWEAQYKEARERETPLWEPMIRMEVGLGASGGPLNSSQSPPTLKSLSLSVKPFYCNIEDRFMGVVLPGVTRISTLLSHQLALIPRVQMGTGQMESQRRLLSEEGRYYPEVSMIPVPPTISALVSQFSSPLTLDSLAIGEVVIVMSLRLARPFYLALDQSRLVISPFEGVSLVTTSHHLGQLLSTHYTSGAMFQLGNPVRLLGGLELLGSPASLVETLGGGLKDFVVYPYQGLWLGGPLGFMGGLGVGATSLLKSITSGTLTSLTNWAWSVSRNIDKLTLDEEEQYYSEASRRVAVDGWRDGLLQGLSGFGIRLLGALGGMAHHPIQNVMGGDYSSPPMAVLHGMSRGMVGMVTRPIGGLVELVAMTGQGVLTTAGWNHQFTVKGEVVVVEEVASSINSLLKYQLALGPHKWSAGGGGEKTKERFVLLIDASQPIPSSTTRSKTTPSSTKYKATSLLLSNLNLYIIDIGEDMPVSHYPLGLIISDPTESDGNLLTLKTVPTTTYPASPHPSSSSTGRDSHRLPVKKSSLDSESPSSPNVPPISGGVPWRRTSDPLLLVSTHGLLTCVPSSPPPNCGPSALLTPPQPSSTPKWRQSRLSPHSASTRPLSICVGHPEPIGGRHHLLGVDWSGGEVVGSFLISPQDKTEFENVLAWLKGSLDSAHYFNAN